MPLAAASPPVHLAKSSVPVLCFLMLLSPLPLAAQGNRSGGGITPMSKSNGITVFTSPTVLQQVLVQGGLVQLQRRGAGELRRRAAQQRPDPGARVEKGLGHLQHHRRQRRGGFPGPRQSLAKRRIEVLHGRW